MTARTQKPDGSGERGIRLPDSSVPVGMPPKRQTWHFRGSSVEAAPTHAETEPSCSQVAVCGGTAVVFSCNPPLTEDQCYLRKVGMQHSAQLLDDYVGVLFLNDTERLEVPIKGRLVPRSVEHVPLMLPILRRRQLGQSASSSSGRGVIIYKRTRMRAYICIFVPVKHHSFTGDWDP